MRSTVLETSGGAVTSMSKQEALKALDALESFVTEVLVKDPVDFELLERIRVHLIEVRAAVKTIEVAVAEVINGLIEEYGEPDERGELGLPKGSFAAEILRAKTMELMQEGAVDLAIPLDLAELREAAGIPHGHWRLRAR